MLIFKLKEMKSILILLTLLLAPWFFGCDDGKTQKKVDVSELSYNESELRDLEKRFDSIRLTDNPENSCKNTDIYWYKNGTLSHTDGVAWKGSEELNRLSTCGGFLFKMSKQKEITVEVLSDDFILSSRSLMQCIDAYYSHSENENTPFNKAAMLCMLK
jgi:hypothetical protein